MKQEQERSAWPTVVFLIFFVALLSDIDVEIGGKHYAFHPRPHHCASCGCER